MQIESLYFPTCCAMNGKIIGISEADMTMLERMKEISKLKDNWNQNGATAFSKTLLTKVENILLGLEFQPEIFPTACDAIQLEYDKEDGSYLEILIDESEVLKMYHVDAQGRERYTSMSINIQELNKAVKEFYE